MASAGWLGRALGRLAITVSVLFLAVVVSFLVFVWYPSNLAELFGVGVVVVVAVGALKAGSNVAGSALPEHDVGEVAVEGPIVRRRSGGPIPGGGPVAAADEVVEQIERADEDGSARALLLKLNTPGGQVVPSDDIRLAAQEFDGPTVAYATDTCASGGYWIASGCDELWAREGSIVGSIGVIGSQVNAKELADRVGLRYERLAAGEYKDAGMPLKEMTDDDREYLQGIIDGFYDDFVDRVVEGRDLEPEEVRDTEARVYLGEEAREMGLVDELGTREDVEAELAERLGVPEVTVKEFERSTPLPVRFQSGVRRVAYAFGAGVAGVVADDGWEFRV
ncbi:signal peptide peptidase SppA [Halobacteriales archaeon QS_8_69_26]|nr:MAG: signal peptide peptidase SppA [Halobacteriales archaeon QS_8_69_26]